MHSNFDSPLKLTDGVVEACGELDWGAGETEAIVAVTITQKGEKISGAASSPPSFEAPEEEWMLNVQPSSGHKKFKKGPARATGVIHAIGDSGELDPFSWEQDVELDPDAEG
jgi:hypothetical protein